LIRTDVHPFNSLIAVHFKKMQDSPAAACQIDDSRILAGRKPFAQAVGDGPAPTQGRSVVECFRGILKILARNWCKYARDS